MSSDPFSGLIARLELISRDHPQRVLRLRGELPSLDATAVHEPFELLIYRGFSSSTTHPTAVDPDQPVLPSGVMALQAELLQGPLDPRAERWLSGPYPADRFLVAEAWLG